MPFTILPAVVFRFNALSSISLAHSAVLARLIEAVYE